MTTTQDLLLIKRFENLLIDTQDILKNHDSGLVEALPFLFILLFLLLLSGFFSGTETAFFNLSAKDRKALSSGNKVGRLVVSLQKNPRVLLLTLLLGNMIANVFYFILSSILIMKFFTSVKQEVFGGATALLAIVLFGEVVPKFLAAQRPILFSSLASIPLSIINPLVTPLDKLLGQFIIEPIHRLAGSRQGPSLNEKQIKQFITNATKLGVIDPEEQDVLQSILSLRRLRVKDVMTPRVNMITISRNHASNEIIEILKKRPLTQIPIRGQNLDVIEGMLHVKKWLSSSSISNACISKPNFIPATATLEKLLDVMQTEQIKTAIVVDEYGGTSGIVSLEDVIEEIIGDISHYEEFSPPERITEKAWILDGNTPIAVCQEAFGLKQHLKSSATIGALLVLHLEKLPKKGDFVKIENFIIEAREVEGARVIRATVRLDNRGEK